MPRGRRASCSCRRGRGAPPFLPAAALRRGFPVGAGARHPWRRLALPPCPRGLRAPGASPVSPLPLLALGLPVRSPSALAAGAGCSRGRALRRLRRRPLGRALRFRAGPPAPCGCPRCGSGVLYPSALRASCRLGPPRWAWSWALAAACGPRRWVAPRPAPTPSARERNERKDGGHGAQGACVLPPGRLPRPCGSAPGADRRRCPRFAGRLLALTRGCF